MVLNPFSSSTETDSNATPIEQKQAEKDSGTTSSDDWKGFFLACLKNLVLTLIIGLIGANFIFFTSLNDLQKEAFFPSHLQDYFPTSLIPGAVPLPADEKKMTDQIRQASSGTSAGERVADAIIETGKVAAGGSTSNQLKGGKSKQRGGGWKCRAHEGASVKMPSGAGNLLGKLGIPPSGGWPYSMRKGDPDGKAGFVQNTKDWWALSTADTYCQTRHLTKIILGWSEGIDNAIGGSDGFLIFMGNFIMLLMSIFCLQIPLIPVIIAMLQWFHCMYRAIEVPDKWYYKVGIALLAFLPSMFPAMCAFIVQPIQYFVTFLLIPFLSAPSMIREVLACNQETLALIFGGLCVSSAATSLDTTMASTMLIVWIILLIRSFF
jgi:hypothetical protein